ncbi:Gfo/Idh/MocA family protein [Agromyces mangrovi Wang et al. 2018]|uniref:Gfo/Idh/MocA family protein n=1 Tax=Agromyces mangrovi TaxID=1858653 RepID=UPI0025745679|nr:Gfo/Idh/MocA family oxidoreductase [Agromyces mangrovi]BDZ65096.1 oxidoreductase [Agromyces mangrovi]
MGDSHRVGIVGLGNISRAYLDTLARVPSVRITAVADLDRSRAEAVASALPEARAATVDELVASPDVDTVLNLTIPAAHADVALAAIAHDRDVYGEKPLAATLDEARAMTAAADASGVRLGCAPDTVLGTGTQTARAAIDGGRIGRPLAATAVMVTPGHERWHPNPDFYYRAGGGPLLDMGPYYVAALIHLLGPVRRVTGMSSRLRDERVITGGERAGERIRVEVATHVSGVLEHDGGALSTLTTSFDGTATTAAPIEVHGELGTLSVPDPNHFDGEVRLAPLDDAGTWHPLAPAAGYVDAARGVGLLDFLRADASRPARAGADVALHSLEVMTALLESAESGERAVLTTTVERPVPVPLVPAADWRR